MRAWVYNPHSGGRPVPSTVRLRTEQRIRSHAAAHYAGKFRKLDIRFRGALCYIDAWVDETTGPLHLCRLRFLGNEEAWSLAFDEWQLIGAIGLSLLVMSLMLQYGLSRLPANRAIVILLFELVVAAIAAHYLAGERLRAADWIGGALIASATLASGWMESRRGPLAPAPSSPPSGARPPPS